MLSTFTPQRAEGLCESYELRIAGEALEVRVADGRFEARQGEARDPDLVVRVDVDGLLALLGPRLSAAEALASGSAEIDGDASVFGRCTDMLAWPARDAGRIAK
jgi:putative sterol carrier protein